MSARWALVAGGRVLAVVEQPSKPQLPGDWVADPQRAAEPGGSHSNGQFQRSAGATPAAVTARQARLALRAAGLLDDVEAAIDAIPDATARAVARITWDHSQEVQRTNPLVVQLGEALGLTAAQVDALFVQAAAL